MPQQMMEMVEPVKWAELVGRKVRVMRPFDGRVVEAEVLGATDLYVKLRIEKNAPAYFHPHVYILAPEEEAGSAIPA